MNEKKKEFILPPWATGLKFSTYESINGDVITWNWHDLPADDPERLRIERMFENQGG
jgi:hypothetical protein